MKHTWSFVCRCDEFDHPDFYWEQIGDVELKKWAKNHAWFKSRQTSEMRILKFKKGR